jgi:hypothetical protein
VSFGKIPVTDWLAQASIASNPTFPVVAPVNAITTVSGGIIFAADSRKPSSVIKVSAELITQFWQAPEGSQGIVPLVQ